MFEFTREEFPRLNDQDVGRVAPYIFGPYTRALPIGYQVGTVERLVDDLTKTYPANGGTLRATNPDTFARFASAGKLQLDKERITYAAKNPATLEFTGITRAADRTEAAPHTAGAAIYEVLATAKYAVCENASTAARATGNPSRVHYTKSVDAVYLDGRKIADLTKPPIITINLDDKTVAAGRSFVTLTVDISSIPAGQIRQPLPPLAPRRVLVTDPARYIPPTWPTYFGSTGGGGGATAGFGGSFFTLPTAPIVATGDSGPPSMAGPPRMRIINDFPAPVIGELEVDVTGLQDDALGTITGSASTLLDRPARIVRTLLREAWAELDDARYHLTSFAETHAKQLGDGLHWALAYEGQPFLQWRAQALLEGKAYLFQWAGLWHYVYLSRSAPVYTFTADEAIGEAPVFSMTPRTDLTTELPVTYNRGLTLRRFVLHSSRGIPRYGVQRNRSLVLQWIYEDGPAHLLGAFWLARWDTQRLRVSIPSVWQAIALNPWDPFAVDVPLMAAYGKAQLTFNVLNIGVNVDDRAFAYEGEEADPPGISLSGRVCVLATLSLPLSGQVVVGNRPGEAAAATIFPGLAPGGLAVAA